VKTLRAFRERLQRYEPALAMFTTAQHAFYQELGPLGAVGNDGEPDVTE